MGTGEDSDSSSPIQNPSSSLDTSPSDSKSELFSDQEMVSSKVGGSETYRDVEERSTANIIVDGLLAETKGSSTCDIAQGSLDKAFKMSELGIFERLVHGCSSEDSKPDSQTSDRTKHSQPLCTLERTITSESSNTSETVPLQPDSVPSLKTLTFGSLNINANQTIIDGTNDNCSPSNTGTSNVKTVSSVSRNLFEAFMSVTHSDENSCIECTAVDKKSDESKVQELLSEVIEKTSASCSVEEQSHIHSIEDEKKEATLNTKVEIDSSVDSVRTVVSSPNGVTNKQEIRGCNDSEISESGDNTDTDRICTMRASALENTEHTSVCVTQSAEDRNISPFSGTAGREFPRDFRAVRLKLDSQMYNSVVSILCLIDVSFCVVCACMFIVCFITCFSTN